MSFKSCRNCKYFPCLKFECNFGSKEGCSDFKSIVTYEIEKIDNKKENTYENKK